jgi:hypothetical protein
MPNAHEPEEQPSLPTPVASPSQRAEVLSSTDRMRLGFPVDHPVSPPVASEMVRRAVARVRDAEARRRRALRRAAQDQEPSAELVRLLAQLRASITVHVGRLRDDGVPPERMLPQVKVLVQETMAAEGWQDPSNTLLAQVVRWSIEAYYDEPELRGSPRFF